MGAWYAVEVKRSNERRGELHLSRQGVSVFLPFIEVVRRYPTRRITLLEPLFPGYLFARMESLAANPRQWHVLRWTPGVKRILGTGETPIPVPERAIGEIQERVHDLGFVRPGPHFAPGSRVRMRGGPLAGLEAIFDRPTSRVGRVQVLLELLGQQRGVEVDVFDLEAS